MNDREPTWIERARGRASSDFGLRVERILAHVFRGIYHIGREATHKRVEWDDESYIEIVISQHLATWDFDGLTRLVLAAHHEHVRVDVSGASRNYTRLQFNPRAAFDDVPQGWNMQGHPSIFDALLMHYDDETITRGLDDARQRRLAREA